MSGGLNIFSMVRDLGDSYETGYAGARKRATEDRRQTALSEAAAEANGGPVNLKSLGTKLLTIGDLTGAMTAAQLAQAQEDRAFNQGIQTGNLDIARSRLKMDQDGSSSPVGKMLDDAGINDPNERKRLIVGTVTAAQAKTRQPQTAGERTRDEINARAAEIRAQGLDTQEPTNRAYILTGKMPKPQVGSVNPFSQGGTFNEGQGKAAGFSDRMLQSEEVLRGQEGINSGYVGGAVGQISSVLPNAFKSDDRQKFEQARRDFVNSQLRRESGAAIAASEFANADKQYFPQPGDGEEVIKQKRENRRAAIEAMGREGGPSYVPSKVFDKDGKIVPYQRPPSAAAPAASGSAAPIAAPTPATTGTKYQEGARYRSKSTGKMYVVRNGQPVEE